MGMTIEQKIKTLLELYHYIKGDTHFCGYNEETATQSLETAIDTMRKYQRIEQIYQKWNEVNDFSYNQAMRMIGEVVEDGNDDC